MTTGHAEHQDFSNALKNFTKTLEAKCPALNLDWKHMLRLIRIQCAEKPCQSERKEPALQNLSEKIENLVATRIHVTMC
ncbi:hypothetical protein HI914_06456 [Erysiphe necator]|nr:hypothetical protein HI914_06456 [Erysiphe necator]